MSYLGPSALLLPVTHGLLHSPVCPAPPPVPCPWPSDLVAYWDFNAGAGYTIKDVTNHGHDLIASQRPHWEVVRWLSTCGNGVVEGNEECDDGDLQVCLWVWVGGGGVKKSQVGLGARSTQHKGCQIEQNN